jgi:glycosyltransferase involved in cell wall biosynthesis
MNVVQLMASPFFGGPERVVLGLAQALPAWCRTVFLSFAEGGRARPLLDRAAAAGFEAVELSANFPRVFRAAHEIANHLRRVRADLLCCSGYKPNLLGWLAARRAGVPVVAIAHGWTAATWRVRFNEWLDRRVMRYLDAVICVSAAQADTVRRSGVRPERVVVIRNAVDARRFEDPDPEYRRRLLAFFPRPPQHVVVGVGRLSPEKGFDQLIAAAARVDAGTGFVVFGDGPRRADLERRVRERGLVERFVFAGFQGDVDRYLPWCDVAVSSSYAEGLPINILEAQAAGVPVVATAVGGTAEVIEDGVGGFLVQPGDPAALAARIAFVLRPDFDRRAMGQRGRRRVRHDFNIETQAAQYLQIFTRLTASCPPSPTGKLLGAVGPPGKPVANITGCTNVAGNAADLRTADTVR